ncbi:MAG TPA: energy transducer TonB [Solirubrobacteraceae bacterium]
MTRRPWLGVGVSIVVHVALFALVVVSFARDDWLPPLVVDLRDGFVPDPAPARSAAAGSTDAIGRPSVLRRWRSAKREAPAPPPPRVSEAPAPPPPAPMADAPAREPEPEPRVETPPAPPAAMATGDKPPSYAGRATGDNRVAASSSSAGGGSMAASGPTSGANDGGAAAGGANAGQALALAVPGGGSGVGAEYGPYLTALRQRIQHSVRYPPSARRRGISGTVNVEILILPNGVVGEVELLESSTHQVLDDAALDTIRSLPRMPLPPELPARALRVRVPVVFQIR